MVFKSFSLFSAVFVLAAVNLHSAGQNEQSQQIGVVTYLQQTDLDLFPKEFHALVTARLNQAASRMQVETELATLKQKIPLMHAAIEYASICIESLESGMDELEGPLLQAMAVNLFDDPYMKWQLYAEFERIAANYYRQEAARRGLNAYDISKYFRNNYRPSAFDRASFKQLKRNLLNWVVRPNASIQFCNNLAKKELSLSQLMAAYTDYFAMWNQDTLTLETVDNMLNSIDSPQLIDELSLLPDTKTTICRDTRNYPIHLRKIDPQTLYEPISLTTKLQIPDFRPIKKPFFSDEGIIAGHAYMHVSTQGRRQEMEDATVSTSITLHTGQECPLFAVMDGHGGRAVADYLAQVLAPTIQTWVNVAFREKGDVDSAIRNAMKIGMIQLNHVLKNAFGHLFNYMGSNAICCFIYNESVYTVNVGDSRALISSGQQLSIDANAASPEYTKKIHKRGGFIGFGGRVDNNLLTFSAFGDFDVASIRAFAKTHVHKLEKGIKVRLGVMCDGVTDVFTSAELCTMLAEHIPPIDILNKAWEKGANDNMSMIVVDL